MNLGKGFAKLLVVDESKGILVSIIKVFLIVLVVAALLFLAVGVYFLHTKEQDESIWIKAESLRQQNKFLSRTIKKLKPGVGNISSDKSYKEYSNLRYYAGASDKNKNRKSMETDSLSLHGMVEYSVLLLAYFDKVARDASMQNGLWQNNPLSFPFSQSVKVVIKRNYGDSLPDPFTGEMKKHNGVDLAAERGTAVLSPADGDVILVKEDTFFGKTVKIKHANGYETFYAHLGGVSVKLGQKAKKGTTIGVVGESGWTTGPHLHYELTKNGVLLDPMSYNFNMLYDD
jgi:murein DD-endopeptidase MepM/ murein hydrolase activator NlpD